ncbi:MAG: transposase [Lachnospiraceae bacterium]|nr:transposase [Lachnospiraceae bacterium]
MNLPTRKKLRIKDYNYKSENIYFITICSKNQECIFCNIDEEIDSVGFDTINFNKYIHYSNIGSIIVESLKNIETIYNGVVLKEYVIMPNHLHMLIEITDDISKNQNSIDIFKIVGSFKRYVTKMVNKGKKNKMEVWQKSFYEHIVRDEKDYNRILEYMVYNPFKWKLDEYYR